LECKFAQPVEELYNNDDDIGILPLTHILNQNDDSGDNTHSLLHNHSITMIRTCHVSSLHRSVISDDVSIKFSTLRRWYAKITDDTWMYVLSMNRQIWYMYSIFLLFTFTTELYTLTKQFIIDCSIRVYWN